MLLIFLHPTTANFILILTLIFFSYTQPRFTTKGKRSSNKTKPFKTVTNLNKYAIHAYTHGPVTGSGLVWSK